MSTIRTKGQLTDELESLKKEIDNLKKEQTNIEDEISNEESQIDIAEEIINKLMEQEDAYITWKNNIEKEKTAIATLIYDEYYEILIREKKWDVLGYWNNINGRLFYIKEIKKLIENKSILDLESAFPYKNWNRDDAALKAVAIHKDKIDAYYKNVLPPNSDVNLTLSAINDGYILQDECNQKIYRLNYENESLIDEINMLKEKERELNNKILNYKMIDESMADSSPVSFDNEKNLDELDQIKKIIYEHKKWIFEGYIGSFCEIAFDKSNLKEKVAVPRGIKKIWDILEGDQGSKEKLKEIKAIIKDRQESTLLSWLGYLGLSRRSEDTKKVYNDILQIVDSSKILVEEKLQKKNKT